jgi:large subunit ribosomal protein L24
VAVPEWMQKAEGQENRPVRTVEQPISLASVKLVVPLPDPETGITRDVIVNRVVNGNIFHDRHTGRKSWSRFIAGLNVVIPWPKIEPKEHKDYDCDTLRVDIEAKTFVPTLLKPPMPSTVIDELRNKYSKFRTRHDEEYIQAKLREDEEKEAKKKMMKEMMTPLKEKQKEERKRLKAKGKPKLTEEMLAKIGEVMARNRSLSLPTTDAPIEQTAQNVG